MSIKLINMQCQHCQSVEQFKVGHDEQQDSIAKAVENLQGKTQIQVRSIIRKHHIDNTEYGFALFA